MPITHSITNKELNASHVNKLILGMLGVIIRLA